jgi:hypothetical protein
MAYEAGDNTAQQEPIIPTSQVIPPTLADTIGDSKRSSAPLGFAPKPRSKVLLLKPGGALSVPLGQALAALIF